MRGCRLGLADRHATLNRDRAKLEELWDGPASAFMSGAVVTALQMAKGVSDPQPTGPG